MPVLKPPPKILRNSTIPVRVEEDVDLKLRKYAEFIGSTPAFVVAESLKMLFNRDAEFREWLASNGSTVAPETPEKPALQKLAHPKSKVRTMFDEMPQRTVGK
jgi:predicted transcriptional regulator